MAGKSDLPPEADGAVSIETEITVLRNEVALGCSKLLMQARQVNATMHGSGFNLRFWENRISGIREAELATFNISELTQLKHECETISQRLGTFGKA